MEQMIKANGIELCYETFGNLEDPTILLVMGLGTQMIAWPEALISGLVEAGFHVIIYDNRDVGLSEKFHEAGAPNLLKLGLRQLFRRKVTAPYTFNDMAADGVGLLDGLGIEKAHIVGVSLGGMIAQQMAINHPERLFSMTSIMSTTGDRSVRRGTLKALGALMRPPPDTDDIEVIIDSLMKKREVLGGEGFTNSQEDRDHTLKMLKRSVYPVGAVRQNACAIASGARTEALKSVVTPTLVLHGDKDPLVRVEGGIHTAECIPGARLEILEGMGHALYPRYLPRIRDLIIEHVRLHTPASMEAPRKDEVPA